MELPDSFISNLRSVARRELHIGHAELGHIIDAAADELERIRAENRCLQFRIDCQRSELARLNERATSD